MNFILIFNEGHTKNKKREEINNFFPFYLLRLVNNLYLCTEVIEM